MRSYNTTIGLIADIAARSQIVCAGLALSLPCRPLIRDAGAEGRKGRLLLLHVGVEHRHTRQALSEERREMQLDTR